MKRSGIADLPLHGGRVPPWLAERMTKLGSAITENIVHDYGASAFLSRLSDPFWFQAFGAVMGMDWHSSGITTSVMGALKRGLTPKANELGIYICGGRGRFSRNTPNELRSIAERRGFDGDALVRTSRLTARVDNNAIADGFQIYLHSFVLTSQGEWAVVQQGLNDQNGLARRYHWHSASVRDFVAEPHTAIFGENQGTIMNLVDAKAGRAQSALLDIANEHPEKTLSEARHLRLPAHHEVREKDVDLKRLGAVLAVAYERGLKDFTELLLLEKLGPRTLQSLALVAEVVHGAPSRFNDPARFVTGVDYGAEESLGPPDFHSYVEAWIGDRWWLFDPTGITPLTGLIRIGTGRDAADVAFATMFGNVRGKAPRVAFAAAEDPAAGITRPEPTALAVSTSRQ